MNSTLNINGNNNQSSTSNSNIKVFIRLRPLCKEKSELPIDYELIKNDIILKKANQPARSYCFDGIFNYEARQSDLSEHIVDPFIQQVLDGFNCTVLAYGQTGTGKTFTIEGNYSNDENLENQFIQQTLEQQKHQKINLTDQLPCNAGLVPRAFYKLFNQLKPDDQFKVSVIEIYNEDVYDLLSDNSDSIKIYERSDQKGVKFSSLTEYRIKSLDDINAILQKSNSKRQFASTLMNKRSSRSHVIYQYVYQRKETLENDQVIEKVGKLNLVDLAGSECSKRTGCIQDIRALEAGKINRSLLTLTRVIDALVHNQKYIPFRNSNLTRIIQDTLGGNSKTVLIATLSPALVDFEDSLNTLTFASTVKQVKNNAVANVKTLQNNYLEEKLRELEENLKKEFEENILLEQAKHEEELAMIRSESERLKEIYETKLRLKEENMEDIETQLESKDEEIQTLKRSISKLNNDLLNNNQQKENDLGPASKKRRSTKPLSNANNAASVNKSTEDLTKLIKNDINILNKDYVSLTKKINKLKTLISNQESLLKGPNDKPKKSKSLGLGNQLEDNLSAFLNQMFNFTIQDDFDLFFEHLTSSVIPQLPENVAHELEDAFTEFNKYVREKLELVIETTEDKLNSTEEELKKKTKAINEINEITGDLSKEIKECLKTYKKCKDRVKDMKSTISS